MKLKYFIGIILILGLIVSCDFRPKTSCGCWQSSIKKMDKLVKMDSVLRLFNPKRKAYYQQDLNILFAKAKRMDDYVRYCREIYLTQGLCKEKSYSEMSLWDYGSLVTPESEEGYRRQFSGDWKKDSLRYYRPRRPVTMESMRDRVFFRLWLKVEDDNLPLTEREQHFYDSMMVFQYGRADSNGWPILKGQYYNDSTIFPRMWDDNGIKDTGLQNYLQREQYH